MRLLLIFGLLPLAALAGAADTTPIGAQELLAALQGNQKVEKRIVQAGDLLAALRWAQDQSAGSNEMRGLNLDSCIVEGDLDFMALKSQPVGEAPEGFRTRLARLRIKRFTLVPVGLNLSGCTVTGEVKGSGDQGNYVRGGCVFAQAVDFEGTEFQKSLHLEGALFGESGLFGFTVFGEKADFSRALFSGRARFKNAEFKELATFGDATFEEWGFFSEATFHDRAVFGGCTFRNRADFTEANFEAYGNFGNTIFESFTDFGSAQIQTEVSFWNSSFGRTVSFKSVNDEIPEEAVADSAIDFRACTFHDRVYFQKARIGKFSTSVKAPEFTSPHSALAPVVFKERVAFNQFKCSEADFTETEFYAYADFSDAEFKRRLSFEGASFQQDCNFSRTVFPVALAPAARNGGASPDVESAAGLNLDEVRFEKQAELDWAQIDTSLVTANPATWGRLDQVFTTNGQLKGKNECLYQLHLLGWKFAEGWTWWATAADWSFWGFAVRPVRLLGWMGLLFAGFATLCWSQTRALGVQWPWRRWQFAVRFAWLTSWTLSHGITQSRTPLFKGLSLTYSVAFKVMTLCLLHVIANTSPLLNSLLGKLIPF